MAVFKVEIAVENGAMQTPGDVAEALEKVAGTLRSDTQWPEGYVPIKDNNGDTVGTYWGVFLTPLT